MPTLQPPLQPTTTATNHPAASQGGSGERYGPVAVLLHWLVAATVIGQVVLGIWMTGLPDTPRGLALSPDGRILYLSDKAGNRLQVVRTGDGRTETTVPLGESPEGISLSPDGRLVAASEIDNAVHAVDVASHRPIVRIPAGEFANGLVMHPRGHELYVSNGRGGSVSVIDVPTQAVVATIAVGKRPWNMALTADGGKLYVANGRSDTVSVIDTARRTKLAEVAVGKLPWGVVMR